MKGWYFPEELPIQLPLPGPLENLPTNIDCYVWLDGGVTA
jgi:hypothetical protein